MERLSKTGGTFCRCQPQLNMYGFNYALGLELLLPTSECCEVCVTRTISVTLHDVKGLMDVQRDASLCSV